MKLINKKNIHTYHSYAEIALGSLFTVIGGIFCIAFLMFTFGPGNFDFSDSSLFQAQKSTVRQVQPIVFGDTDPSEPPQGLPINCYEYPPDYNGDGTFNLLDYDMFKYYFNMYDRRADLNGDRKVNTGDEGCMEAYLAASNLHPGGGGGAIIITEPAFGSTLSGVKQLLVDTSGIPESTTELVVTYQVFPGNYTAGLPDDASSFTHEENIDIVDFVIAPRRLSIPLDTLAYPSPSLMKITICGLTLNYCNVQTTYYLNNFFVIQSPIDNAVFQNQNIEVSAQVSGEVLNMKFQLKNQATGATYINEIFWEPTYILNGVSGFRKPFRGTTVPDGIYTFTASYIPASQVFHGYVPHKKTVVFTIDNVTEETGVVEEDEIVEEDAPPAQDTEAVEEAPKITWPEKDTRLFELSTITGNVKSARKVLIYFGSNKIAEVTPSNNPSGNQGFRWSLPRPLAPGKYNVSAKAIDGNGRTSGFSEKVYFRIKLPTVNIISPEEGGISGIVTFLTEVKGSVNSVEFLANSKDGLSNVLVGTASKVTNTNKWSLTVDTSNFLNGDYEVYARTKSLNGYFYESGIKEYTINNEGASDNAEEATSEETGLEEAAATPSDTVTPTEKNESESEKTDDESVAESKEVTVKKKKVAESSDPRTEEGEKTEELKIVEVSNFQSATTDAKKENVVVFNGIGPSNKIVTIYIYSDPIVVTTKTDKDGNWTYSLKKPLSNGAHSAYVTITDKTGTVIEKSSPLTFFIKEARAISEQAFLQGDVDVERESDTLLRFYVFAAGAIMIAGIVIFMILRKKPKIEKNMPEE